MGELGWQGWGDHGGCHRARAVQGAGLWVTGRLLGALGLFEHHRGEGPHWQGARVARGAGLALSLGQHMHGSLLRAGSHPRGPAPPGCSALEHRVCAYPCGGTCWYKLFFLLLGWAKLGI